MSNRTLWDYERDALDALRQVIVEERVSDYLEVYAATRNIAREITPAYHSGLVACLDSDNDLGNFTVADFDLGEGATLYDVLTEAVVQHLRHYLNDQKAALLVELLAIQNTALTDSSAQVFDKGTLVEGKDYSNLSEMVRGTVLTFDPTDNTYMVDVTARQARCGGWVNSSNVDGRYGEWIVAAVLTEEETPEDDVPDEEPSQEFFWGAVIIGREYHNDETQMLRGTVLRYEKTEGDDTYLIAVQEYEDENGVWVEHSGRRETRWVSNASKSL